MAKPNQFLAISLRLVLLCSFAFPIFGASNSGAAGVPTAACGFEHGGECHNKVEALKLKLIAFFAILMTSIIGVCLPIFSRSVPALKPDKDLFDLVKAFASGVILATGYMHVMPDSFDDLRSPCLPENPWRKFPFTTFVAMLSALVTLMIDSFAMSIHKKHGMQIVNSCKHVEIQMVESQDFGQEGRVTGSDEVVGNDMPSQLVRYRVIAQVLELGIIVHSVVIGLSLGTSENPCTIRPLVAALCFHQMFEGMGLGGCILQAEYGAKMKIIMVFFFSCTTPLGIALGIGLSKVYSPNSPTALIVVGLLNASSAGLLNYMALVDLLASDFMGAKLQNSMKLQFWAYIAVLLGAGGMSVMALWA